MISLHIAFISVFLHLAKHWRRQEERRAFSRCCSDNILEVGKSKSQTQTFAIQIPVANRTVPAVRVISQYMMGPGQAYRQLGTRQPSAGTDQELKSEENTPG